MIDLHAVMRELRSKRPVFHSEADFQHALAMEIAKNYSQAQIRLESRPISDERIYLDLWVSNSDQNLAIELKYKTRSVSIEWQDERFDLASHGAQDLGAYDVWKDVQRLERVCAHRNGTDGYVILLTNDAAYWNGPASDGTVGSAFRLHEGRVASGGLFWASHAGDGTMKNREKPISLNGSYSIAWNDYARLGTGIGMTFRYVIIPVKNEVASRPTAAPPAPIISHRPATPTPARQATNQQSKYAPLYDFLVGYQGDRVELTYSRIEEIIGAALPPSSRNHPAQFWANHYGGTHVWATKWMDAGWKVESNNIATERVVFVRAVRP